MSEEMRQVLLNIDAGLEADIEELEKLTQQLRAELLELDIDDAALVHAEEVPKDNKSGDPISWGTLLLTFAASGGIFTTLITLFQSWSTRHERSKVVLEIDGDKLEITGNPTDEQKRLIEVWLSRHKGYLLANG